MIVLEGTDGVGKTCVIHNLEKYNLLDRDEFVSNLMEFNIDLIKRVDNLREYLAQNHNYIIFLINNDKDELERRIHERDSVDSYDKYAFLYNLCYMETYLYMQQNELLNEKLFMIDCTGLTIEEETKRVKILVDKILKISENNNSI